MSILKLSVISVFIFIQSYSHASDLSGVDLQPAAKIALEAASVEVGEKSIYAWQTSLASPHEVKVSVLSINDLIIGYGCDLHGSDLECHEGNEAKGSNTYSKDDSVTLGFVKKGSQAAIKKFGKTMDRQEGKSLTVMTSYKVWSHKDDDHGHGAGTDVWTKINYSLNSKSEEIFVLCHQHGFASDFVCHYAKNGEGEPVLNL